MALGFGFNKAKVLAAAEKNVQQGKLQNAISEYEKVLKEDPKDLTVLNTVGDLCARIGQNEQASQYFRKVGDTYAADGFTVKAIAMYKKLTKLDPGQSDAVTRLAELYTVQGLYNDARQQYVIVADQLLKAGQNDAAAKTLQKILELDPENTAMQSKLADLYMKVGKKNEARAIYFTAAQSLYAKQAMDAADESLARVLSIDANNVDALLLRATIAVESGNGAAAAEYLKKIPNLDSRPDAMRTLLRAELGIGNFEDAEPVANKLVSVHNDVNGVLLYGDALFHAARYQEGIQFFEKNADRVLPAHGPALVRALDTLVSKVKESVPALEGLRVLFQKAGEPSRDNELMELLAHAYVGEGKLEKARDLYKILSEIEPENPLHRQNYKQVVARMGDDSSSRPLSSEQASQAVMLDEIDNEHHAPVIQSDYDSDVQAAVRAALTDSELFDSYNLPAKAIPPLEAVLAKAPRDAQVNARLAALYAKVKRFGDAAERAGLVRDVYSEHGHAEDARKYQDLAEEYSASASAPPPAAVAAAPTLIEEPGFTAADFGFADSGSAPAAIASPLLATMPPAPHATPSLASSAETHGPGPSAADFGFEDAGTPFSAASASAPEPPAMAGTGSVVETPTLTDSPTSAFAGAAIPEFGMASPESAAPPATSFDVAPPSEAESAAPEFAIPSAAAPDLPAAEFSVAPPTQTSSEEIAPTAEFGLMAASEGASVTEHGPEAHEADAHDWESMLQVEHPAEAPPPVSESATPEASPLETASDAAAVPEAAYAEVPAPAVAASSPAATLSPADLSDLAEELRFYISQSMWTEAQAALSRLQAGAPTSALIAEFEAQIRTGIAAGEKPSQTAQPAVPASVVAASSAPSPDGASISEFVFDAPPQPPAPPAAMPAPAATPAMAASTAPATIASAPKADADSSSFDILGDMVADLEESLGDFAPAPPAGAPAHVSGHASGHAASQASAPPAQASAQAAAMPIPQAASAIPAITPAITPAIIPTVTPEMAPTMAAPMTPAGAQTSAAATTSSSDTQELGHAEASSVLSDLFDEFKEDVEVSAGEAEDPDTHYSLGVAFREMGLLDEAIGELQKVCHAIDKGHPFRDKIQAYTWLAQCLVDKGAPEAAARWYEKALKVEDIHEDSRLAIYYDMANAYEVAGDKQSAYRKFMEVYSSNIDYRDVAERVKALK